MRIAWVRWKVDQFFQYIFLGRFCMVSQEEVKYGVGTRWSFRRQLSTNLEENKTMKSNDKFPILQVWPYTLNGPSKLPQTTNQPHERDGISFILFSHWNCKKLRPQSFLKPAHWKGTMIPPVLETKQLHPKDRLTVSRTFWTIPGVRSVGNSGRQLRSVFPRFRASIWRSCGQNACRDLLNQSAGSYWTSDATYCTGYVGAAKNIIMLIIFIFTWFPRQVSILIFTCFMIFTLPGVNFVFSHSQRGFSWFSRGYKMWFSRFSPPPPHLKIISKIILRGLIVSWVVIRNTLFRVK